MSALIEAIRTELGLAEGYLLPWRAFGCQIVDPAGVGDLLSCPAREAIHQCEVIGPHTQHRWSTHTIAHERAGNGHSCAAVGDGQLTVKIGDPVTGRTYVWWAGR